MRKIDFRYLNNYKPSAKKEKNEVSQEHQDRDKDKNKAKYYNSSFANINPLLIQTFKKYKRYGSRQSGYLAIKINATKIAKNNNDKVKDLSHIKCYTYKQKDHYANKYSKKAKN